MTGPRGAGAPLPAARRTSPARRCSSALALFPFGQLADPAAADSRCAVGRRRARTALVAVREGLTETIIFFQRLLLGKPVSDVMLTNSFSMSTTGYGVRRYQKLYVVLADGGAAGDEAARSSSVTALAIPRRRMTDSAGLEIDRPRRSVARHSGRWLDRLSGRAPAAAARSAVHVHIEDGRYFLQTTDRQLRPDHRRAAAAGHRRRRESLFARVLPAHSRPPGRRRHRHLLAAAGRPERRQQQGDPAAPSATCSTTARCGTGPGRT